MGNQCICMPTDGKKLQSTLVQNFSHRGSTAKSSLVMEGPSIKQTLLPQEMEQTHETINKHSESFYTAHSPTKSFRKRGNSFPGSETEYMSFDVNRMSVLNKDVQNMSQRISALSRVSKQPSSQPSDDIKRLLQLKRSLSQVISPIET